jgi:hypothetical protein
MLRGFVCAALLAVCTGGYAQATRPGAAWYEAGHLLLAVFEPAVGFSGSWQFDRASNGDIRIVKEEQRMATNVSGSVMMICGDAAMLTKGLTPTKGSEQREIDGPVLLLQLALRLLERGAPQGPHGVTRETVLAAREANDSIRVRRGTTAASEFLAPWRLQGKAAPLAADKIRFEMRFAYSTLAARDRQFEMELEGLWQKESRVALFENDMSIDGWQVYRVDAAAKKIAGSLLVEQIAVRQPRAFKTLGEVRSAVERNWGSRAPSRPRRECRL